MATLSSTEPATATPLVAFGDLEDQRFGPEDQLMKLAENRIIATILRKYVTFKKDGEADKTITLPEIPVNLIAQYCMHPKLTNWHTALQRLKMLPNSIPRLPENIHQILYSDCPIYRGALKKDGTPYRVIDTHLLYLLPSGTLNELEARVKAYGEEHLAEYGGINPLQLHFFCGREQHGDTRFSEPKWVLLSENRLPGSCFSLYTEQRQMAVQSSRQIPSLRAVVGVAFFHKIATRKSILPEAKKENGYFCIYTRVEETVRGYPLIVGDYSPSGLSIDDGYLGDTSGVLGLVEV